MEIKVGNYDVLESGSIICMDGYPVVFSFGKLTYEIIIDRNKGADENGKNIVFMMNAEDMNQAQIHLNLKDSVVLASGTPYTVGNYNNRSLAFAFHIDHLAAMADSKMPLVLNYIWLQRDAKVAFESMESGNVRIKEK